MYPASTATQICVHRRANRLHHANQNLIVSGTDVECVADDGNTCHVASCTTNYQFTGDAADPAGSERRYFSNENLLAARTVINADEVFLCKSWRSLDRGTTIQVEMAKLNDTNDLAMGHLSNLRTETFYTRCGITLRLQ